MIGAIVGGLIAAGSAIGSAISAKRKRKRQEEQLRRQKEENERWYERRYNEDYTQSATAQDLLNRARQAAEDQYRRAAGAAKVGGATTEGIATAQRAANEMIADATGRIAAQGDADRRAVEEQYMERKDSIEQRQSDMYGQAAEATRAAGQAGVNAGAGLIAADFSSYLDKGKGMFEDMFRKKVSPAANQNTALFKNTAYV